jgi:hypothetical protein
MPVIFIVAAARLNTRQRAQTRCSSNKLPLAPPFSISERSTQTHQHASPRAIAPPLASRRHARGTLVAQIPIAELAARPTERTSRDFVPWRFSDAGCRSAWLDHRCRRPKTSYEGREVNYQFPVAVNSNL